MENPRPEKEKTIKEIFQTKKEQNNTAITDVRNIFRQKTQSNTAIKDIRNFFRLKKEVKEIKDVELRNIKNRNRNRKILRILLSMKKIRKLL